ncbi:MAG: metallopeptidase family protein [Candidatus Doudnabacteria bacterium]|nr:metallopeptidase family protein [Candidatus Doudnabacteria bacterium]
MIKEEFEQLVSQGIEAIPAKFLELLNNVAIVVEDHPTPEQAHKLRLRHGWTLFGLYEGVPQNKRGPYYGGVLPDKITIFQEPIERVARDLEDMKEIIKNTVWHEIAHHFGMDEEEVHEAELKRKNRH